MTSRRFTLLSVGVALSLVGVLGLVGPSPSVRAATALPEFTDGHGITLAQPPQWFLESDRTFYFTVRTGEVPRYAALQGQNPEEHAIMVTLPEGYDPSGNTRYPVQYHFHGHPDRAATELNKQLFEESTKGGVPLISVAVNGSGRGWYTNWTNPPAELAPQNWQNFHLDQVIPFIEANLPAIGAREGRAASGHSMGGFGAFHYAVKRPELFGYVGSFSGGLDLQNPVQRAAVVATTPFESSGSPAVPPDAIFGPPVVGLDAAWNEASPAQHVDALRGMGVAMYTGDGSVSPEEIAATNPALWPSLALRAGIEAGARQTNLTTHDNLNAAGIPHTFIDYGGGAYWAPGCTGQHADPECLTADMKHFVGLLMQTLRHP